MALDNLLLHPKTKQATEAYLAAPTQVLALIAPTGAGKKSLALQMAAELLGKADLAQESRLISIERQPDKKEIAIGAVRDLIMTLRTKQPGETSRVVFIEEADRLSPEAQNALLKTLEQPNPDTLFILSISHTSRLLPTVMSRAQKLVVHPTTQDQSQSFFTPEYSEKEVRRAWLLSEGYAGQLSDLLESKDEQPLAVAVQAAKQFLTSSRYQRLISVDVLSKDKEQVASLLSGLSRILKTLHHTNIQTNRHKAASNLLQARQLVSQSQMALNANTSSKVVLLKLILNLRV